MNIEKIALYGLSALFLIISAVLILLAFIAPSNVVNVVGRKDDAFLRAETAEKIDAAYSRENMAFLTDKNIKTAFYLPRYESSIYNNAEETARKLWDFTTFLDTEREVTFEGNGAKLTVSGDFDKLVFEREKDGGVKRAKRDVKNISVLEAVEMAEGFIKDAGLSLNYYAPECETSADGVFGVNFIPLLDGAKNYAAVTTARIDGDGDIFYLDYVRPEYEKLTDCKIKTADEAFYELPPDESGVVLKSCEIVYYFADSVVQPAYLFKGEKNGDSVSFYINAAKY